MQKVAFYQVFLLCMRKLVNVFSLSAHSITKNRVKETHSLSLCYSYLFFVTLRSMINSIRVFGKVISALGLPAKRINY
jgi:hypothetical protein